MRFLLGVIIGIVLTVGAAYLHDKSLSPTAAPATPGSPATAGPVVNWDTLQAIVDRNVDIVREEWNKIVR